MLACRQLYAMPLLYTVTYLFTHTVALLQILADHLKQVARAQAAVMQTYNEETHKHTKMSSILGRRQHQVSLCTTQPFHKIQLSGSHREL